ncbi:MAG: energy transducer TonB [Terracidiphilus sp.]|jgi:TonB family protein
MYTWSCVKRCAGWRKARKILLSAAVFALAAGLALPARAGDDRAVKSRVAPVYPEIAKRLKITGEVKLEALVNAEGKVKSVKAVSGNHMLGTAAEDAVRQWRFEPGDGDAVVVVAVNFTMN